MLRRDLRSRTKAPMNGSVVVYAEPGPGLAAHCGSGLSIEQGVGQNRKRLPGSIDTGKRTGNGDRNCSRGTGFALQRAQFAGTQGPVASKDNLTVGG